MVKRTARLLGPFRLYLCDSRTVDTHQQPAYAAFMDLRLTPELAARLEDWSSQTGRAVADLVEDALTAHLAELADLRSRLDRRYDEAAAGEVEPIPAAEARRLLNQRLDERRSIA